MNSPIRLGAIFADFSNTSAFEMFGTNLRSPEKSINITSGCEKNGVAKFNGVTKFITKWLSVLLIAILVLPVSGQASQFVGNFFGPPPTDETPSVIEVPVDLRKIGQEASAYALLGVMGLFELARLREFGVDVNDDQYRRVLTEVNARLVKASSLISTIDLDNKDYNLNFPTDISGIGNTVGALESLITCLAVTRPDQLARVSDLVELAASASGALAEVISTRGSIVTTQPFLALVGRELSAYLFLGALIARIGEATYFPTSDTDGDMVQDAYGLTISIQCS